jgi:flagellar assembly factor FliW
MPRRPAGCDVTELIALISSDFSHRRFLKRVAAMQIDTSRFGKVQIEADDILLFPHGLIAFEDCRHWVLLSDAENESLGWLQSVSRAEVALPVISPRRYVPGYQVRVARNQLQPLELTQFDQAFLLSIVSQDGPSLTVNLKAPIVVNLDRRLGRQVITTDEQPVALVIAARLQTQLRNAA